MKGIIRNHTVYGFFMDPIQSNQNLIIIIIKKYTQELNRQGNRKYLNEFKMIGSIKLKKI